jgi:hypothetical protein
MNKVKDKVKDNDNTLSKLRAEYIKDASSDDVTPRPVVYLYDKDADVKQDSIIEQIKADKRLFPKGIDYINEKLEEKRLDEITPEEEHAWRLAFEVAMTNEYTLTKEKLCDENSWWINKLKSVMDPEEIDEIMSDVQSQIRDQDDIYVFLDILLPRFTIEQLYAIGDPDMEELDSDSDSDSDLDLEN